eukprot:gene7630-9387_t
MEKLRESEEIRFTTNFSELQQKKEILESILLFRNDRIINNSDNNNSTRNSEVYSQYKNSILLHKFKINQTIEEIMQFNPNPYINNSLFNYNLKNKLLHSIGEYPKIVGEKSVFFYSIPENSRITNIKRYQLLKPDYCQVIKIDSESHIVSTLNSTVYVKKNQYIQVDKIFIFGGNETMSIKILIINPLKVNEPIQSEFITTKVTYGSSCTCVYDGGKYIYIFGGYTSSYSSNLKSIMKRIMRFDIRDNTLDQNFSKSKFCRKGSFGCSDGKRFIYLTGGLDKEGNNIYRIDRFDFETRKMEELNSFNYVPRNILYYKDHLYYIIEDNFCQHNLENNQFTTFKTSVTLSNLFFDSFCRQFIAFENSGSQIKVYCQDASFLSEENKCETMFKQCSYSFNNDSRSTFIMSYEDNI